MADLLFVCMGNRCRSPVAEALTAQALQTRGLAVTTASAGLLEGGVRLPPETVRVLKTHGIDARGRVSQQVSSDLIRRSSLIIGMDRGHLREVSVLDPGSWHRTFTLKELVRRGSLHPRPVDEPLARWAEGLGGSREPSDLMGSSDADDIADPMGLPFPEHARTAAVIEGLVDELVNLAFPDGRV